MYFEKLVAPVRVVVIADAAYKSNKGKTYCLALRGDLVAVVGSQPTRSLHPRGHSQQNYAINSKRHTQ
eukprot:2196570-Prorocentrum_lima.AAC.1